MMQHDLNKIARDMQECHDAARPWRLPMMSFGEMIRLLQMLDGISPNT